jgi:adenosine deaminase
MLALPARMDLISEPDNTRPAVNSSVKKYVNDAFLFLISTGMRRSYIDDKLDGHAFIVNLAPMSNSTSPPRTKERDSLKCMPKVELHCHLELAFRASTLQRWACDMGMDVGTRETFNKAFLVQEPMQDLPSVLHKFLNTRDVIDTEEKVERLAFEVCEDMHLQSNVRVLELRYAPSFLLDVHPAMNADRMLEAILRGIRRAESAYPMVVGLIGLLQRIKSVDENTRWCDWILERKEHFVGVDLADDEVAHPAEPFAPLFRKAKSQGLGITVHAGEPNVSGAAKNIWVAIDELGADRIGHGVQAIHDDVLIERLARQCIPLELCPWSNVLTQAVPNLAMHPFKALMDRGVQTTLNTDDPGVMDVTLLDECHHMMQHQGMTLSDLAQCNDWARRASFIPKERVAKVWPNPLP